LSKVTTKAYYGHSVQPNLLDTKINKDTNDETNVVHMSSNAGPLLSLDGQVRIISVPYIEGSHCPTNTNQLVCIAKQIRDMHSNKWKHADLRLCNMVFNGDEGHLIDFDFSGQGAVRYPKGFVKTLFDAGALRPGKALELVSAYDDAKTFCIILDMLTAANSTDRHAFFDIIILIDDDLRTFTASVKSFRDLHKYQGKKYNRLVDDYECEQSVAFFNGVIKILESTVIELEFKDEEIQEHLETHGAIKK
jgi:serine/threonine protein kinase